MPSPTSSASSRYSFHTSKSAPDLCATPNWDPDYRDESPARIAQSPRYPESSDEFSSPDSDIEDLMGGIGGDFSFYADSNAFGGTRKPTTKIYEPWVIRTRSQRFPSQIAPIVSLDSIRLSNSTGTTIVSPTSSPGPISSSSYQQLPNNQSQRLTASILIRNLAYMKRVYARFTTDGWKTHHDVPAEFVSVVMPNTPTNPGLDRFSVQIDVDQYYNLSTSPQSNNPSPSLSSSPCPENHNNLHQEETEFQHLCFEFAICGEMNGETYWDNNLGRNHELLLTRCVRAVPLMSAATAALMVASKGALKTVEAVIEAAAAAAMRNAEVMAVEAEAIKKDFELKQQQQMQEQQGFGSGASNRRGSFVNVAGVGVCVSSSSLTTSPGVDGGSLFFKKVNSEVTLVGEDWSGDEDDFAAGGVNRGGLRNTPKVSRHAKFTLSSGTVPRPGATSSSSSTAPGSSVFTAVASGSYSGLSSHYAGAAGSTPHLRRRSGQGFAGGLYSLSAESFLEELDDQSYTMTSMPPSENGLEKEWAMASATSPLSESSSTSTIRGRSATRDPAEEQQYTPPSSAPETRASSVTSLPSLVFPVNAAGLQHPHHHHLHHGKQHKPQYQNDDTLYMRSTPPVVGSPAAMASGFSKYSVGYYDSSSAVAAPVNIGIPSSFPQQQSNLNAFSTTMSSYNFLGEKTPSQTLLMRNYDSSAPTAVVTEKWSPPLSVGSNSSSSSNASGEQKQSLRRKSSGKTIVTTSSSPRRHHHRPSQATVIGAGALTSANDSDLADILGGREKKYCDSIDDLIEKRVMKSLDGWSVWDSVDECGGKETDYGDDEGGY
ncbi:UNVERIFIED_CONTAM: hypothetical protein HDU68_004313 [Siphonaria sp. JEL0065]|nr:hypothetical protein HDU68_004313 [Siphonaria sp. JEL0065]